MKPGMNVSIAAVFALATAFPSAHAQSAFKASPGLSGVRLDFDTDEGKFSSLQIDDVCALNAIRGKFHMPRLGVDARWAPVGAVVLEGGKDSITLQFISLDRSHITPILRTFIGAGKSDKPFQQTLSTNSTLDIAVDWTPKGEVTVTVGNMTQTAVLPRPINRLTLSGSTGEATFEKLSIGRTGKPAGDCTGA